MNPFQRLSPGGDEWFRQAGDPAKVISITRAVSEDVFATRAVGYGMTFSLDGVDTECLSEETLTAMSSELINANRLVPEDFVSYQIVRKRRGLVPTLLHTASENPQNSTLYTPVFRPIAGPAMKSSATQMARSFHINEFYRIKQDRCLY